MWDRIERLEQPKAEALTLDEVKQQCRMEPDDNDDKVFLERCIKAARQMVEGPEGAGLGIMAALWQLTLDCFPTEIRIPMGPVLKIESITYIDPAGAEQTLPAAFYHWRKGFLEARIQPASGSWWPATRDQLGAVTVTFTAGYPGTEKEPPDPSMVPESLHVAMLMLIAHWNDNRETSIIGEVPADVQFGFDAILDQFRVGRIA
jgi:uncharacterized phiE125 gp8 family phage protein